MCGRYYSRSGKQQIAERAEPRRTRNGSLPLGAGPFLCKESCRVEGFSTINAKAETIQTSATWREPFKSRRCLVPADGFYEWKALDDSKKPKKQPYVIMLKTGEPLAFAGLWDAWKEPKPNKESVHTPDSWLQSYAIITTEANELMSSIHTRMPVIFCERDWQRWLSRGETNPHPSICFGL